MAVWNGSVLARIRSGLFNQLRLQQVSISTFPLKKEGIDRNVRELNRHGQMNRGGKPIVINLLESIKRAVF
jgi:hypothetical protein